MDYRGYGSHNLSGNLRPLLVKVGLMPDDPIDDDYDDLPDTGYGGW